MRVAALRGDALGRAVDYDVARTKLLIEAVGFGTDKVTIADTASRNVLRTVS